MRLEPYSSYKDVDHSSLKAVPSAWQVRQLKHVAKFQNSNVDKVSSDDEEIVKLCNYTDVYYNEKIHDGINFMRATASAKEIRQFSLRRGDVLITKDSEDRNDIGVPAIVAEDINRLVCGYHLTLIRPDRKLSSEFLLRYLQSDLAKYQFKIRASGVTRYSLGQDAIGSLLLSMPTFQEQELIVRFLDYQTARIDRLIEKQQRLIELLDEKRQAVISHAVTKGLNPNTPMKNSGVDWIPDMPEHWVIGKIKWYLETTSGGTPPSNHPNNYYDGDIPWLRTLDLNNHEVLDHEISIAEKALKETSARMVPRDSVLIAMYGGSGTIGKNGLLTFNSAINQAICAFLPNANIDPRYLHYYMQFYRPFWMVGAESSRKDPNIGQERIGEHFVLMPPLKEQKKIAAYISGQLKRFIKLESKAIDLVKLLNERRSALISAAVTGKIDVRYWKPPESANEAEERDQELLEAAEEQAGYG